MNQVKIVLFVYFPIVRLVISAFSIVCFFFQGAHLVVRPFDTYTDDTSFCYNANRFGIGIKRSRHSRSHQQQTSSSLNRKRNPPAISFRHIHYRSSDCPLTHFLISADEANIVLRSELMVYCKTFSSTPALSTHTQQTSVYVATISGQHTQTIKSIK